MKKLFLPILILSVIIFGYSTRADAFACTSPLVPTADGTGCMDPNFNPNQPTTRVPAAKDGSNAPIDIGAAAANTPASDASNPATYNQPTNSKVIGNGNLPQYVPLEPLPGVDQTGQANFGVFLSQIFKTLIILAALIAVGAFVFAGITYMVSEVVDKKSEAKKRLMGALYGLFLLLGSWVILFTINPQLLSFNGGLSPIPVNYQLLNGALDQATVTTNNGTTVPTLQSPGQDAAVQAAKNNPNDPVAQQTAAQLVQKADAACGTTLNGAIAPAGNPCTQGSDQQYLGTKIYNSCAVINTPTGQQTCFYNK